MTEALRVTRPILGPVVAFAALTFSAASSAIANEPLIAPDVVPGSFSANVALASEYFFRGMSQTDDVPAVQGGFDWEHELGVYLGAWASNVKFTDASLELDLYGGLQGEFWASGVSWSAGFIYYYYPGADSSLEYDFVEATGSLGYDLFDLASAKVSFNWSPDYFAGSGDAFYTALGVDIPLGKHFTLSGHVGKQNVDNNVKFALPNYVDYSVGLSTNVAGFDLGITWTDTDMSDSECHDACGMVVGTISRSF
jgi:uncharacterized protein (TIGR02001 family)